MKNYQPIENRRSDESPAAAAQQCVVCARVRTAVEIVFGCVPEVSDCVIFVSIVPVVCHSCVAGVSVVSQVCHICV